MTAAPVARCRPPASAIQDWYAGADLLDAYGLPMPGHTPRDARVLARLALADPPVLFRLVMGLRDRLVAPAGIKSSWAIRDESPERSRIDFFPVLTENADEVVIGADDRHLDFRTSMMLVSNGTSVRFVSTTAVRCHNRTGRLYLALIRPFHVAVVKAGLDRLRHRLEQATLDHPPGRRGLS